MELEFDKEMDAILRRSGPDALRGVLVGDDPPVKPPKHIDADSIAAFVENAVPQSTRRLYIEHFADCGRCRKLLSTSILMNGSAAMAAAPAAEVVVAADAIPWYLRLFHKRNLALAMGALVLTFSGVLGYLVLQNRDGANATVSQVTDTQAERIGGPSAVEQPATAPVATNAAANSANIAPAANMMAANTAAAAPNETAGKTATLGRATGTAGEIVVDGLDAQPVDKEEAKSSADSVREQPKLSKAAPPPAPVVTQSAPGMLGGVRAEEDRKNKDDADETMAKKRSVAEDSRYRRDLPAAPAKSGPVRGAGPVQNQSNQINNQSFEMPVMRIVGGKTFDNRNGAWYDRAYKNQATTNYRRGTGEYKQLDSGLRSIADNLGGTVILVWKGKAYRIN